MCDFSQSTQHYNLHRNVCNMRCILQKIHAQYPFINTDIIHLSRKKISKRITNAKSTMSEFEQFVIATDELRIKKTNITIVITTIILLLKNPKQKEHDT